MSTKENEITTDVATTGPRMPAELAEFKSLFEVAQPSPAEILRAILAVDTLEVVDPESASKAIVARILASESMDEILAMGTILHADDILDIPLHFIDVHWQASDYAEGANCYAVIDAQRLDTGEDVKITCGAMGVLTGLFTWWFKRWPPFDGMLHKATKATKAGFYPINLSPTI